MSQDTRHLMWLGASVCAGMLISALVIQGTQMYVHDKTLRYATDATRIALLNSNYPVYIVIQSYDPATNNLTALVRSNPVSDDIPMRLKLTDNPTIERQDGIVENGTYVGLQEKVSASAADLTAGTRALAHIRLDQNALSVDYLLIGNPFPRP